MSFKFCNNESPPHMNDVFKEAGWSDTTTKASLLKLNQTLWRTNHSQNNISYIAPIIWNNLPDSLKTTDNLNTYKHKVKEHFFPEWETRQTIHIAIFNLFILMHKHFSFLLLLLFLSLLHYCYYNYYNYDYFLVVAVAVTVLAGVLPSLLSAVVVALIKYQLHLLYQPLFLSFSYVSCCFISI